jgi:hypothetical protein
VNALPEVESNDGVVHTTDIVGDVSKLTQFKSNSVDVACLACAGAHLIRPHQPDEGRCWEDPFGGAQLCSVRGTVH